MRNMVLLAAVSVTLWTAGNALACRGGHRHCGGHCHSSCYSGCSSGSCGSCGTSSKSSSCPTCKVSKKASKKAQVIVRLPKNAQLTINGHKTISKSSKRRFESPLLNRRKKYHYVFTAQVMVNGKLYTISRKVTVRAGKTTRLNLNDTKEYVSAE